MNSRSRSGVTSPRWRRELRGVWPVTGWNQRGGGDDDDNGGGGGVGVRARAGTTIRVCVCCRSAANLWCVLVWGERGFRGAANEQPASLELDARVTYLPELVRESDPPGRACAGSHLRNRRILFLSLIRKPRARAHTIMKNTPRMPTLLFRLFVNRVRRRRRRPRRTGVVGTRAGKAARTRQLCVLLRSSATVCRWMGWRRVAGMENTSREIKTEPLVVRRHERADAEEQRWIMSRKNTQYRIHSHERPIPV